MLYGTKGFTLVELVVALSIFTSVLVLSTLPIRHLASTFQSSVARHGALHFLDDTRSTARRERIGISVHPEIFPDIPTLTSVTSTNANGFGFTETGSTMFPTTLQFESGSRISLPVGLGKINVK
jgi:prepilin-type N-terminal cleavage/methylation domain-containing protein